MAGKVGFIGLGVMGGPMCRNLATKSGRTVVGFDLRPEAIAALADAGVEAATSIADVMRQCDIVFLSLPGEREVRAVCTGPDGAFAHARPGTTVVDTSTTLVSTTRQVGARALELGIDYLDSPVTRTREAAVAGTLSIMVGGSQAGFERIEPLLRCMGTDVTHCGAIGSGEVCKILNNMLNIMNNLAVAEALTIGRSAGVDDKLLLETISKGSGDSFVLRQHGMKFMLPRHFPEKAFPTTYALKDLGYALALAEDNGIDVQALKLAIRRYEESKAAGNADTYFPAVIRLIDGTQPVKA